MIRTLRQSDLPTVSAMLIATQNEHARQEPEIFRSINQRQVAIRLLEKQLYNDAAIALCHEVEAMIAGYLIAVVSDIPESGILNPRRIAMLNEIAVADEFQGQGIADGLLYALIDRAKTQGLDAIRATHGVFNEHSARMLERHGIRPVITVRERSLK